MSLFEIYLIGLLSYWALSAFISGYNHRVTIIDDVISSVIWPFSVITVIGQITANTIHRIFK